MALTSPFLSAAAADSLIPSMLLRRDVIVGFFGLSKASAEAWRLLTTPTECWAVGRGEMASGCECREEAVEGVAEALGETAGLDAAAAPGEVLLAGAAMVPGLRVAASGSKIEG
jgi:hypothetical protein